MDSTFRWMSRLTNFCVTVSEQPDPARVLAAFGADLDTASVGDARDSIGRYSPATGYRPVVRVVALGKWCVAIEDFSFEGVRQPVLRRLSAAGRAVSISLDHLPAYTMAFAELGTVTGPFPVPRRGDVGWQQLDAIADRVGVSQAVAEQVRAMLVDAGIDSGDLLAVLARPSGGVEDDSPAGRALRRVLAEQWQLVGSPMGSRAENVDAQAIHERVSAGLTAAALVRSGPEAAVAEMLHRRLGSAWRDQLVAGWEGIVVRPESAESAAALLAAHEARRARSIPLPPLAQRPPMV